MSVVTYQIEKLNESTYIVKAFDSSNTEISRGVLQSSDLLDQKAMALNLVTEIDRVMNE